MRYICSVLTVSDIQCSRKFYEGLLNQKVKFDFGENVMFHGGFSIHLRPHFKKLIDNREVTSGGNNFELYFEYDNVDEVVALLKKHNVSFIHEVREQAWKQKVARFYDPDKNIIEVGESMEYLCYRLRKEGMAIGGISEITNMPIGFVKASIEEFKGPTEGACQ